MNAQLTSVGTPTRLDLSSISQKMVCDYNAPYVAIIAGTNSQIVQVCCNHWDCQKHGIVRAGQEYWRIVEGAINLAKQHTLYFYTFTCRGGNLQVNEAERSYGLWTNRLLSTMRASAKTQSQFWAYAQVTERQNRGHPHSHLIMSYLHSDALLRHDKKGKPYYYSKWFRKRHIKAGLGTQSRITPVNDADAASRYIAKYLFKASMFTVMPDSWHRVRYSQSFPKRQLDELPLRDDAFPLLTKSDWERANKADVWFKVEDMLMYEISHRRILRMFRPAN